MVLNRETFQSPLWGKQQYKKTVFKRSQSKTLMNICFGAIKAQNIPRVEYKMLLKAWNWLIENN